MGFTQGHALLVGVGTYQDGNLSAPVTERDAEALSLALQDQATAGYPADQVSLLSGQGASKAGITAALQQLAKQATTDSSVLIFLCGHGAPGPQGAYYFLSYDARHVGPGTFDPATVLSSAELLTLVEGIPARKTLLIFNTCFSGVMAAALDAEGLDASLTPPPQATMEALLSAGEGRVVLSACRPDEKSYFTAGAEHTLFTQVLLGGLAGEGGIPNRNGYISVADLYDYLYEQVSTGVKKISPLVSQEPVLTIREQVGPFRVALYKGSESHSLDADAAEAVPEPTAPGVHRITAEQARNARDAIMAGRDVYQADHGGIAAGPGARVRTSSQHGGITFHGSADIQGSVLVGGDSEGPISVTSGGNSGGDDLDKVFAEALRHAKELPADDQEIVTPVIKQAQAQAQSIQQGNPAPDAESVLEKRLKNLVSMAPDIAEVVLASLTNPAAGIAAVIRKIAERVKASS